MKKYILIFISQLVSDHRFRMASRLLYGVLRTNGRLAAVAAFLLPDCVEEKKNQIQK